MAMIHQHKNIRNSCEQILESVRSSTLNYSSTETPFSLYITIRKSLVKVPNSEKSSCQASREAPSVEADKFLKVVMAENAQLKEALEKSNLDLKVSKEVINTLDSTVATLQSAMKKRNHEDEKCREAQIKKDNDIDTLKGVIKKKNAELETQNTKMKEIRQNIKSKEKEVYNLENVRLNNLDKIRALKDDLSRVKSEKTKLEKQLINKEKKATKSKNVPAEPDQTFHSENSNHTNPLMPNSAANNNNFNNSMEATDLQSSLSYKEEKSLEPNETETETFLTEEGVRAILEKAMKKQRVDLKLFRQIDD